MHCGRSALEVYSWCGASLMLGDIWRGARAQSGTALAETTQLAVVEPGWPIAFWFLFLFFAASCCSAKIRMVHLRCTHDRPVFLMGSQQVKCPPGMCWSQVLSRSVQDTGHLAGLGVVSDRRLHFLCGHITDALRCYWLSQCQRLYISVELVMSS